MDTRKVRVKKSVVEFATGSESDWLAYVRQIGVVNGGSSLAAAIIGEYAKLIAKKYPPEDAALWALEQFGCLEA